MQKKATAEVAIGTHRADTPRMTTHAAVWIDHKEARIFHFQSTVDGEETVKAPAHHLHKHPRGPEGGKSHPEDDKHYFQQVSKALETSEKVLIVGPSTAKLDLIRYAHKHDHALEARIVAVETVDHPSDRQMIAYAKEYFHESARDALHHVSTSAV